MIVNSEVCPIYFISNCIIISCCRELNPSEINKIKKDITQKKSKDISNKSNDSKILTVLCVVGDLLVCGFVGFMFLCLRFISFVTCCAVCSCLLYHCFCFALTVSDCFLLSRFRLFCFVCFRCFVFVRAFVCSSYAIFAGTAAAGASAFGDSAWWRRQ